ncbi:hypothetical protein NG99_26250 [Erwinia typographi]|uniref:Uncharacterized protein n=1 Tax=Erwinia typographi TaxID=371042 RepID=A0A0A3YLP2_9GAMM|nr:hypothetical protein [Erwinia typographi]KGT86266.1 hypothetical protein NG99_26250 [Erwinia typographi]
MLIWLKSLFTHSREKTEMSEPLNEVTEQQPAPATTDNTEAVLEKLKELVAAAGAQAHAVIDDLIELAKKLV